MLRPDGSAAKSSSTFLAIAECGLLAPEAIQYGDSLQTSDVDVEVQLYM